MAGWSGGRKVVAPGDGGLAARSGHSIRLGSWKIRWPCNATWPATRCTRSSWKSSARIGDIYAVNTVVDEDRDLVFVNFGEIIASHLAAVDFIA